MNCSGRFPALRALAPLALALIVSGCNEGASGGDETILSQGQSAAAGGPTARVVLVVDPDAPGASDANDGLLQESGGTGPLLTIGRALALAQPGVTIRVRESAFPYREAVPADGSGPGGIRVGVSGTQDAPIVIEGFPG